MPRSARIVNPIGVYHIICRGNNKATLFHDDHDRHIYMSILRDTKKLMPFRMFHYVIMSNHVHLLIELLPTHPLSDIMKRISQGYAQYFGRKYGHVGHVWQDRYKNLLVEKDSYLLACGIYIELNPVRAQMVQRPGEYRWSSYRHYGFGMKDGLVDEDPLFETLGGNAEQRRTAYQRMCESQLGTVP